MIKKEIISKGLLEAYITEDLTTEEIQFIETNLQDSEVREEYNRIQNTLESIAFQSAIQPNRAVWLSIISRITGNKTKRSNRYMLAASVSLALISTAAALFFYLKYQSVGIELIVLQNQNKILSSDIQTVSSEMDRMKNDLTVLINPAFSRIVLSSTQDNIVQQAVIYYNKSEKQVYLNSSTLPELSDDQQYQLWALIDGQPVDAGTFDLLKDQFQLMNEFERVDAFAVTIEKKGGSDNPTLEQMQVYGEV